MAGTPFALGAAVVWSAFGPVALFEFYAQSSGGVVEAAPRGAVPQTIAEPWVAAMYYPYSGNGYRTHFTVRPADRVTIDPQTGGVIRFAFPGVGTVRIELKGSSASPRTFLQGLTTPGGHHGHRWDILAVLEQAKPAYVGGWIERDGVRSDLKTLTIDGDTISWVGRGAQGTIATD